MREPSITVNSQEAELHRKKQESESKHKTEGEASLRERWPTIFVSNTCSEIVRLTDTASFGILLNVAV